MNQLSLKKNVSNVVFAIASFSASEDVVKCPDVFIFKKIIKEIKDELKNDSGICLQKL